VVLYDYLSLIDSRFSSSYQGYIAIHLTFIRRVLSACGAPAAVWTTLMDPTSSFHSFTNSDDGNTVFRQYSTSSHIIKYLLLVQDGWMALRLPYITIQPEEDTHYLSGSYLSYLKNRFEQTRSAVLGPKLYFSYNTRTQQTTIMTTDLNQLHICMIRHLKKLSGMSPWSEEIARLLIKYITVVQDCFTVMATTWDEQANGPVCRSKPPFRSAYPFFSIDNTIKNFGERC